MVNLTEEEKKLILNLHTREKNKKKILKEQISPENQRTIDFFKSAKDNGCLTDPTINFDVPYIDNSKSGPKVPYIKGVSKKVKPGAAKRIYQDFTWEVVDQGKVIASGTWYCAPKAKPLDPVVVQSNQTDIANYKRQGGWKEYSELTPEERINANNPEMWRTTEYNGVKLYSRISDPAQVAALDKRAQEYVQNYINMGWKLASEVQDYERQYMVPLDLKTRNPSLFPNSFIIYGSGKASDVQKGQTYLKQELENQSFDRDYCKKEIQTYWNTYKSGTIPTPEVLLPSKRIVQACYNMYYNQWGFLGREDKWDSILEVLSREKREYDGVFSPSGSPAGENYVFLLKRPANK